MVDSLYDFQVGHLLFDTGWTLRFWSLLYLQVIGYYVVRLSNFFIMNSDGWGSDPVPHEQEASTVTTRQPNQLETAIEPTSETQCTVPIIILVWELNKHEVENEVT